MKLIVYVCDVTMYISVTYVYMICYDYTFPWKILADAQQWTSRHCGRANMKASWELPLSPCLCYNSKKRCERQQASIFFYLVQKRFSTVQICPGQIYLNIVKHSCSTVIKPWFNYDFRWFIPGWLPRKTRPRHRRGRGVLDRVAHVQPRRGHVAAAALRASGGPGRSLGS